MTKTRPGRNLLSWIRTFGFFVIVLAAANLWQTRSHVGRGESAAALAGTWLTSETADLQEGPTLVYFFAPWCGVCRLSIENLNHLRRWFVPEHLRIVLVALDYDSEAEVKAFVAGHELPFPLLLGTTALRDAYQISVYPSYYLMDAGGQIRHSDVGYSSTLGMAFRYWLSRFF